jgi:UDP-N-acetylglucosamine transferase subunit ALG13
VRGGPPIFVTIGSMFPFDRLIRAMDAWAAMQADPPGMLAQIGDGGYEPVHMRWVRSLPRADYARAVEDARLVVAHAGMGSVISAGEHGRPIVLMPRRAAKGEHTNDHQVDTVRWLRGRPGIHVADAEADLGLRIAEALADGELASLGPAAPPAFLAQVRRFAEGGAD